MQFPSQSKLSIGPLPPQIPHSSFIFPSQSHSPSGIPFPPQIPHSSNTSVPLQFPAQSIGIPSAHVSSSSLLLSTQPSGTFVLQ